MTKNKAEKKIRKKLRKVKPCPFCNKYPNFDIRIQDKHDLSGSIGHFVVRKGCCSVTGLYGL